MLEWAEIPYIVMTRHTDENFPITMPVPDVPAFLAEQKALAVAASLAMQSEQHAPHLQKLLILAADTIVVLDGEILGKPADKHQAIEYLQRLGGRTHEVITGVCLLANGGTVSFSEKTSVTFNLLNKSEIEWYVGKYQPFDKAGAYAIQEWIGVTAIKHINGDYYNVMGLPISRVVSELKKMEHTSSGITEG